MKVEKFRLKKVLVFLLRIVVAVKVLFQGYGPDTEANQQNSLSIIIQEHKTDDLIWTENPLMHNKHCLSQKLPLQWRGFMTQLCFAEEARRRGHVSSGNGLYIFKYSAVPYFSPLDLLNTIIAVKCYK